MSILRTTAAGSISAQTRHLLRRLAAHSFCDASVHLPNFGWRIDLAYAEVEERPWSKPDRHNETACRTSKTSARKDLADKKFCPQAKQRTRRTSAVVCSENDQRRVGFPREALDGAVKLLREIACLT